MQPCHSPCARIHSKGHYRAPPPHSGVAAFMSAQSKTPYITPSMNFPFGYGVVRGRRVQQLGFSLTTACHRNVTVQLQGVTVCACICVCPFMRFWQVPSPGQVPGQLRRNRPRCLPPSHGKSASTNYRAPRLFMLYGGLLTQYMHEAYNTP